VKIIAISLRNILSRNVYKEQFGFLEGHKIHEAIGVDQEGLHNIKIWKLKGVEAKIKLSKAYERVSYIFIRMILTHLGFLIPFTNWVMGGLHNIKIWKLKGVVAKIKLSKDYDIVSWIFIRMILTHLSFEIPFINWVMGCITNVSFIVLINVLASSFFHPQRGLRKGWHLSPLLFPLWIEGLSRILVEAKWRWDYRELKW